MSNTAGKSASPRSFFRVLLAGLLLLAGTGLFNVAVDPYLLFDAPRIEGFNRWKPRFFWTHFESKAAHVRNYGAEVLILGTSTAAGAFDPSDPAFGGRRAFNLALGGSNPRIQHQALRHALATNPVRSLIVGMDLFAYNAAANNPALDSFAAVMTPPAGAADRWRQWRSALERRLHHAFSFGVLRDAWFTVAEQDQTFAGGRHRDIREDGFWTSPPLAGMRRAEAFAAIERHYLGAGWFPEGERRFDLGASAPDAPSAELGRLLDTARHNGLEVRLVLMPFHARLAEAMRGAGLWDDFLELKRSAIALGAQSGATVWDFSGYDDYSMEPVEGAAVGDWFEDSIHPSPRTGSLMLQRMFAPAAASPIDFGRILQPADDAALASRAEAGRAEFLALRAADAERVAELVRAAAPPRDPSADR